MYGAIIGDITGSPWEGGSCDNPMVELMGYGACFTDDTVCTVAIADALLRGADIAQTLRDWVCRYPNRGYGGAFHAWAHSVKGPYGSWANGGAMRVSPAGLLATTREEALLLAERTAEVTHNHPEGIQGAQAIALAIWLGRQGASPETIRAEVEREIGYALDATVAQLSESAGVFSVRANETAPAALVIALESTSFEETLRNVLRVGGDTDTIGAMAGGVAEVLYGIPEALYHKAQRFLDDDMFEVMQALYAAAGQTTPRLAMPPVDSREGLMAYLKRFLGGRG